MSGNQQQWEILARSHDPFFLSVLKVRLGFSKIPYRVTVDKRVVVPSEKEILQKAEDVARQTLHDYYGGHQQPEGTVSLFDTEVFLDYTNQRIRS